jgi:uncharacterized Fe-S center protein
MGKKVFFTRVDDGEDPSSVAKKLKKLFDASGAGERMHKGELIGIKTHFGERGNTTHLHPQIVKAAVDRVRTLGARPFLVETSTLYRGRRSNAVDHIELACEHGFGFDRVGAPVIMADGLLGDSEVAVTVEARHLKEVKIASEIAKIQGLVVLSHFKGHMAAGFGGAIKNIGMGLASRRGKLAQHSVMSPRINREACTACGACIKWCPEDAVSLVDGKAQIDSARCIGCGECLAVCRDGAVMFDWGRESRVLQEMMAEYVLGVTTLLEGRLFYFNFLLDITKDCDCMNGGPKVSKDIGIVASADIVAVEKASCDLFHQENKKPIQELTYPRINPLLQVEHAAQLGLGDMEYELVRL